MPHAVGYRHRRKSHVDEQAYMAVAQIVYADTLHARLLAPFLHGAREKALRDREHALARPYLGVLRQVVADGLCQELGELDGADRFGRLGVGDDIATAKSLVGLVDAHGVASPVERIRREGQKLAFSDAGPVEYLEDHEQPGAIHHGVGELEVLLLRPEAHLLGVLGTHLHGAHCGVGVEAVVTRRMVEYGGQLVVERAQVGGAVAFSLVGVRTHELVLPLHDVQARYLGHSLFAEPGKDPRLDGVLLLTPCVLAQPRLEVGGVHLEELGERHGHGASRRGDEVVLPRLRLLWGGKAPLALVDLVAELVFASELGEPGSVLRLLNGHRRPPSASRRNISPRRSGC